MLLVWEAKIAFLPLCQTTLYIHMPCRHNMDNIPRLSNDINAQFITCITSCSQHRKAAVWQDSYQVVHQPIRHFLLRRHRKEAVPAQEGHTGVEQHVVDPSFLRRLGVADEHVNHGREPLGRKVPKD